MAFRFVPSIEEMERLRIAVLTFVDAVEGTRARESHPDNSEALRIMRYQEVIEGLQAIDLILNPKRFPFEHPERNETRTQGWKAPGFRALTHLRELLNAAIQACKCESICNDLYGGFDIGGGCGMRYDGDDPKMLEWWAKIKKLKMVIVPKGWSPRVPDYVVDGMKQCADSLALAMRIMDDPETAKQWPARASVTLGGALPKTLVEMEKERLPENDSQTQHVPPNAALAPDAQPLPQNLGAAQHLAASAKPNDGRVIPIVDESRFSVVWKGRSCELGNSPKFRLMKALAATPNRFTTFAALAERMGGDDPDGLYHVKSRLAGALKKANMGDLAGLIRTVDGHYGLFTDPGASQEAT